MKRIFLVIALLAQAVPTIAQDAIVLTTPIVRPAPPNITKHTLSWLHIEIDPAPRIIIRLSAIAEEFTYPCTPTEPPAKPNPCTIDTPAKTLTLINNLNTANLSTRSLQRRIFDRLILDFPDRFVGGATVQ